MNIFICIRILVGLILLLSGIQKVILPYQNFLYIIQGYEFLPSGLAVITAKTVPWVELFIGLFLVLGFWLRIAAIGAASLFGLFIVIITQAFIRKIPLDECGCFGELISIPPQGMLLGDIVSICLTIWLIKNHTKALSFSLDKKFS
ncbi:MAG: putative membrane protein YphA (DoxX/SURF4 family) [Lysobacterales bacterium]|jgi:uncharacterized membrane protein YphA (DoxX/SURF4 family)